MLLIREGERSDAAVLTEMITELDILEGNSGGHHSEEAVLRDGFGTDPAFHALLARLENRDVGYLLWYPAYDTDLMARKMWVSDIYVRPAARGLRCGHALLAKAAAEALARGYRSLELPVRYENQTARAFYEHSGGKNKVSTIYRWDRDKLKHIGEWNLNK